MTAASARVAKMLVKVVLRFDYRTTFAGAKCFQAQRPAPVVSGRFFQLDLAEHRILFRIRMALAGRNGAESRERVHPAGRLVQ